MDAIEAIMTTRAIRRFTDRPVADADIETCLRAAQQAPSGGNVQPQQYVVVTEPEPKAVVAQWYKAAFDRYESSLDVPREFRDDAARRSWERTRDASRHLADTIQDAPAIVVFLQANIPWEPRDEQGSMDIGRLDASVYPAVQNFCVAARSMGLGTALTTVIRIHADEVLAALGVPEGAFEIAALVPVGYPSGNFGVAPRKPAAAVTHWNRWGDKRR
ncbi:MAG: nitroreductase family protein [Ilumatobacter sp.]|uniref:nitroreductase family protein n=1 Tax=Ilumatobacter sp. TaxID=1967498 RepID=UPI002618BC40|nr:nitroreductase family protein [Ilumatobacter sp.]MDJ0771658.1 nitroreductase family protein [Ilumatobacter sp.]